MTQRDKIRVGVLYGGRSGEHEISLVSAANVIENLDRTLFEVIPIGIDKQGNWYLGDSVKELTKTPVLHVDKVLEKKLFNSNFLEKTAAASPSLPAHSKLDVIFPVVHGVMCEDGTVQGLLELADVPYVGCGVLASAVGMDKDFSKRLVREAGIATPDYITIKRGQWNKTPEVFCQRICQQLPFPVFVKPANTGSSVGVYKVKEAKELTSAIQAAFQYDTKVVVEQGIDGLELEVAVLEAIEDGQDFVASVVGEIRPRHEFYSYAAKYLDDEGADLIIPAPLSETLTQQTQEFAKKIFATLGCEGMARVDLFLERKTNQLYFNEVNTIPGFTKISMYPKLMAASGVAYSELLTHLIQLAMKRHKMKSALSREYTEKAGSTVRNAETT